MKKAIMFSLATLFSLTQMTACSSEDLAFGAGVIIGAIIGDNNHHHHRHNRRHRTPYRPRYLVMANEIMIAEGTEETQKALEDRLTKDFRLSEVAANKLSLALMAAEEGDNGPITSLGLREKDIKLLAKLSLPKRSSVAKVAYSLGEDPEKITKVFEYVIEELKAEAADINSPMWNECLDAGTWKTPENPRCSDVRWNGCSPDTGATLCVAK